MAAACREVRFPSGNLAAQTGGGGIILEVGIDQRQEADVGQADKVSGVSRLVRSEDAEVAIGRIFLLPPVGRTLRLPIAV